MYLSCDYEHHSDLPMLDPEKAIKKRRVNSIKVLIEFTQKLMGFLIYINIPRSLIESGNSRADVRHALEGLTIFQFKVCLKEWKNE